MRTVAMVVPAMLLFACGGDDAPPIDAPVDAVDAAVDAPIDAPINTCGANGNGTAAGQITEGPTTHEVSPVVRVNQFPIPGQGVAIVLDEVAGACGVPASSGDHLVLGFCEAPTARTYSIVRPANFSCPGTNAIALLETGGGMDIGEGVAGAVTITSVLGTCVSGTYDVDMQPEGGGPLSEFGGVFNAVICP
jgi:hypothetical protein